MEQPAASLTHDSRAFDLLDEQIRRWIWQQRWPSLRPAQEAAVEPVLAADRDVLICAATAAGKTEAAFLPICTRLLRDRHDEEALGQHRHPVNGASDGLDQLARGIHVNY